jgi:Tol biopolymer transport system component
MRVNVRATAILTVLIGLASRAPAADVGVVPSTLVLQVWRAGGFGQWSIDTMDLVSGRVATISDVGRAPTWSRDGSRILFHATGQLGSMNADGGDVVMTPLPPGIPALIEYPRWSPDETKVLLASPTDRSRDIYLVDLVAQTVTALAPHPRNDAYPDWSPDGQRIVFGSGRDAVVVPKALRASDIFTMDLGGDDLVNLTNTDGLAALMPTYGPDGQRIAYVSMRPDHSMDLWVMNADGSNQQQLTAFLSAMVTFPSWSPDGRRIIFSVMDLRGVDAGDRLYVVDVDGSNLGPLPFRAGHLDIQADWLADARAVSPAGKMALPWAGLKSGAR